MFNPYDFSNINKNEPDAVPDGIVDASDYHELLKQVTVFLRDTDYGDASSRMVAMMNVINLYHSDEDTVDEDKLYGVVIAVLYHIQSILAGTDEETREEYFRVTNEEILPQFEKESKILPFYESDFGDDYE